MSKWQYKEIDGHKVGFRPFYSCPEKTALMIDDKPCGIIDTDKLDLEIMSALRAINAQCN